MTLYVRPPLSCADRICAEFDADQSSYRTFLLFGPKGGGKSTELRRLGLHLQPNATVESIDLDASGILASEVSASDLLYLSGLAWLRKVRTADPNQAESLHSALVAAYTGGSPDSKSALGSLTSALEGLVAFSSVATTAAVGAGFAIPAALPIATAAAGVLRTGLKLWPSRRAVVAASSAQGRALQEACVAIARAVRDTGAKRLCLLIDGLEKMNGQSNERFDEIFEQTLLLANTDWGAVIATPPVTLAATNAADALGYRSRTVWGFGPSGAESLKKLLKLRFDAAGVGNAVREDALTIMAEMSGGLPRHAVQIAYNAVMFAINSGTDTIDVETAKTAARELAETLAKGLTSRDYDVLGEVEKSGELPGGGEAPRLFSDMRILAIPPVEGNPATRYIVHPLVVPALRDRRPRVDE